MIVCICHRVTEKDIKKTIANGAQTVSDISRKCSAGMDCGACRGEIRDLLRAETHKSPSVLAPVVLARAISG